MYMIRGMSYYKGIFFMNSNGIAHATVKDGQIATKYMPIGVKSMLFMAQRLLFSIPLYFALLGLILFNMIVQPEPFIELLPESITIPRIPEYALLYFMLGYHFIFPRELKKYHGAEHKVFSYRGERHLVKEEEIGKANIVNRNCSTNSVILIFLVFLVSVWFVGGWLATGIAVLANFLMPKVWPWGYWKLFFPVSAFMQRHVTTAQPDSIHLRVAILSYMSLMAQKALTEEEVWQKYHAEQERIRQERELQERIRRIMEEQARMRMEIEEQEQISNNHP
jgi:uncharacterized protein YqhQ